MNEMEESERKKAMHEEKRFNSQLDGDSDIAVAQCAQVCDARIGGPVAGGRPPSMRVMIIRGSSSGRGK